MPERLTLLPHPYGMLASEGRGSVMSPGIDWTNWIAPGMFTDLVRGATAPGRAYTEGLDNPGEEAMNMALNLLGVNLAAGPAVGAGALGMFGGRLAKTADRGALKTAEFLEGIGTSPRRVHQETGWYRGADDQWKFEIPDNTSEFLGVADPHGSALEKVLNHPGLFDAYPQLKFMKVRVRPDVELGDAGGSQMGNLIELSQSVAANPERGRSTLLHELQHKLQDLENFGRGTSHNKMDVRRLLQGRNPESIPPEELAALQKAVDEANAAELDRYIRSSGEVEARNVQKRLPFTEHERRMQQPWRTEDVPRLLQQTRRLQDLAREWGT